MLDKCPGQSSRDIKVGIYVCQNCGLEVEIFSDEMRAKCPKCGKFVQKEKVPSCIEWCKSARECLGEKRWKEIQEVLRGEKNGTKGK